MTKEEGVTDDAVQQNGLPHLQPESIPPSVGAMHMEVVIAGEVVHLQIPFLKPSTPEITTDKSTGISISPFHAMQRCNLERVDSLQDCNACKAHSKAIFMIRRRSGRVVPRA